MQRGQAPWGELKEKIRGSSSGIEVPQCRQANRSENVATSLAVARHVSTSTMPSASADRGLDRVGQPLAQVRRA